MLPSPPSRRWFAPAVLLAAALLPGLGQAGARFSGYAGYQVSEDGNSVTVTADAIENTSAENATTSLLVKLWAIDAPYNGGSLSGTVLGSFKLNGLAPGRRYTNVRQTVALNYPAAKKNYAICLTVSEFVNKTYAIVDHRNMPNPRLMGPRKTLELAGPWQMQTSYEGGTIDISVAKISHHRKAHTGTLRLQVWATREPYRGGNLSGHILGWVEKKPLEPGYSYNNVKNVAKFNPPPDGTYHIYLVLAEFSSNQYAVMDYLAASKTSTFKAPPK